MASPNTRVAAADMEAAAWHDRLGARSVSTKTIEDFFVWRSLPANDEAYRRVEFDARVIGASSNQLVLVC